MRTQGSQKGKKTSLQREDNREFFPDKERPEWNSEGHGGISQARRKRMCGVRMGRGISL